MIKFIDMNRLNKKIKILMLFFIMVAILPISAQNESGYQVWDYSSLKLIGEFASYDQAEQMYLQQRNQYENLGIQINDKILKVEYGIVQLHTNSACDLEIDYRNTVNDSEEKLNGCYGIDGAYIDTDFLTEKVYFQISNVVAEVKLHDVNILPYTEQIMRTSRYNVVSGILFHDVKENMIDNNYGRIINLGPAPQYLEDNHHYFSYDGHHFYASNAYHDLVDDLRNGSWEHSINASQPFYDYYQFLPFRSLTNIDASMMNEYLHNKLQIHSKMNHYVDYDQDFISDILTQSQYDGELEAFWQYQYEYGVNAMLMLSISAIESNHGRSLLSYTRNNLFAQAAFDTVHERKQSRYKSLNRSIYSFAKFYLSGGYVSPTKRFYHGGFLGNKSGGMNVAYSTDPYWGEAVASYYRMLDKNVVGNDEFQYQIGIKTNHSMISIYAKPDETSPVLYQTQGITEDAFIILGDSQDGNWYEIQLDGTLDTQNSISLDYEYDFVKNRGYIKKDTIKYLLFHHTFSKPQYVKLTFKADGGRFEDGKHEISYYIEKGRMPYITPPLKKNALFRSWNQQVVSAKNEEVYSAIYDNVKDIQIDTPLKTAYELNDRIDLKNAFLNVRFENGSTKRVPLFISMLDGFNMEKQGEQKVNIEYAGCNTSYQIYIDSKISLDKLKLKQDMVAFINQWKGIKSFSKEQRQKIIDLKQKLDQYQHIYLTQQELRDFDNLLKLAIGNQIRFVLNDKKYDLKVSGITTSYPLQSALDKHYLFRDTYRVQIKSQIKSKVKEKLRLITDALSIKEEFSFYYKIRKNFDRIKQDGAVLLTINKPLAHKATDVYTVLFYDEVNDEVIQCYTRQAKNTISFMAYREGSYMITSKVTANEYTHLDPLETVNKENMSDDIAIFLAIATVILITFIIILIFFYLKHKKENEVKAALEKQNQSNDIQLPLPPVDVTQALQVLEETLALNTDKIKEHLQEEEIHANDK